MGLRGMLHKWREDRRDDAPAAQAAGEGAPGLDRLAVVVATNGNARGLTELLDSLRQLDRAPWRVIVADTRPCEETRRLTQEFADAAQDAWGEDDARAVTYLPVVGANSDMGRAGAYNKGMKRAYAMGAQWFWLLDTTVAALPDALGVYEPWMRSHDVIQGGVYDYYGENGPTGVTLDPLTGRVGILEPSQSRAGYRVTNALAFQGAMISRRIVDEIGLPDPRIVLGPDGVVWGYLASQKTNPVAVPGYVARSTKELDRFDLPSGGTIIRRAPWDIYYVMRGRGHIARALMMHGDYHPTLFALGTAATALEELTHLVITDRRHVIPGTLEIAKGWLAARRVMNDNDWEPMRGAR